MGVYWFMTKLAKKRRKEAVGKHLYAMYNSYAVIGLNHGQESIDCFCNIFGGMADEKDTTEMLRFFAEKMHEMAEERVES